MKRKITLQYKLLSLFNVVFLCSMTAVGFSENIPDRVAKEFSIQNKGSIKTNLGVYTGETDFGEFDGLGKTDLSRW